MKKIIAIMMVLAMVICGTAFAMTPQEEVSEIVGMEYISLGGVSLVSESLNISKMPLMTVCAICFDEGWYLEYRDIVGQFYGWNGTKLGTTQNEETMSIIMGAMFDCEYVNNCVLIGADGESYTLSAEKLEGR